MQRISSHRLFRVIPNIHDTIRIENAGPDGWLQLLQADETVMIERRIPDLILHAFFPGQLQKLFLDIRVKINAGLQFYIDLQTGGL